MKRYYSTVIMFLTLALAFGCSKSPMDVQSEDVMSEQEIEFKAIEMEFVAVDMDDEPDGTLTISDRRIERLGLQLRHMHRFLERLSKFEQKFPNEDAHKLIQRAKRYTNAAIEAYKAEEYRKCYRYLRNARILARKALKLLKPKRRNNNPTGR